MKRGAARPAGDGRADPLKAAIARTLADATHLSGFTPPALSSRDLRRRETRRLPAVLSGLSPLGGGEAARRLDFPAGRWRAKDVPKLRDTLHKGWAAGRLRSLLLQTSDDEMNLPTYSRDMELGLAKTWSRSEWHDFLLRKVEEAELFYVDAEMTDLVVDAAAAVPTYQVFPDQVPADAGFIVFEHPYSTADPEVVEPGQRVECVAALWARVPDVGGSEGPEPNPGIMVCTLQDSGVQWWTQPVSGFRATRAEMEAVLKSEIAEGGPLSYHNEYPMPFGDRPWGSDEPVPVGNEALAAIMSTWILMHQRITDVREEAPPRHLVERAAKRGRPVPKGVQVVSIRPKARRSPAPEQERRDGESSRTYTGRWRVNGYSYWRNTWYPSKDRHELQLVHVETYIKGPEGAPMISRNRVRALRK